jgi:hypothetical protein
LPGWFTSTGYNFLLNLITTVAELFIGFLVAAAANRAQDALTVLLAHIRAGLERDVAVERGLQDAIAEDFALTKQVHDLQVTMSRQRPCWTRFTATWPAIRRPAATSLRLRQDHLPLTSANSFAG